MLGHQPFYHQHFRRYITIFGTLFNDISIVRANKKAGGKDKTIRVPLSFVNKDKALERLQKDPTLRETWNNIFPRMTFEAGSPTYAGYRKENTLNAVKRNVLAGKADMEYAPAPYDIEFTLSVFATKFEDGLQVVEQILPFFQPEYTINAKEIPELGLERDIHIILNGVTLQDNVEGGFDEERLIEWTLTFTLKGFFYGPIKKGAGLIKHVKQSLFLLPDLDKQPEMVYTAVGTEPDEPIIETLTESG